MLVNKLLCSKTISRLIFISNILLHLTAVNAVISLVGDVRIQHVEEIGAHG